MKKFPHNSSYDPHISEVPYLLTHLLLTYLLTYLLTPCSTVLLEKLTGSAASQEIPRVFGTRKFITVLTRARHLSLSWANSIQSPTTPSHFLKIHLNITLPSATGSPQWSISLRFPHQNPVIRRPWPTKFHWCKVTFKGFRPRLFKFIFYKLRPPPPLYQRPAAFTRRPYPEPTPSSPQQPPPTSWRSILILSSHLRLGLPIGLFPSGFPTKTLSSDVPGLPNFIGARSHLRDFARVCLNSFLQASPPYRPPIVAAPCCLTRRDAKVRFTTKRAFIKAVLCLPTSTGRESTRGFLLTKYEIGGGKKKVYLSKLWLQSNSIGVVSPSRVGLCVC